MPWYAGPPLLERLETIPVEPPAVHGARLPVQLVLRGEGGARWAAGRLAAGVAEGRRRGRRAARAAPARGSPRSATPTASAEVVDAPLCVSVRLEDEVDLARGELIATDPPKVTRELTRDAVLARRPPGARGRPLSL